MFGKTNEKKSPIVVFTTLLLLGALFSFIGFSVPVFASSISTTDTNLIFSVDPDATYNVDSNEDTVIVKIPVFLTVNISNVTYDKYLSGFVTASDNYLNNFYTTIDGNPANYLYFEPLDNYGITISRPDTYNTRIYFDNYLFTYNSNSTQAGKFIGYLVYSGTCTDGLANINVSSSSWTPTITNQYLNAYDYEAGFVNAVVYALNNATDINTIINILNNIDSDTGYLPDVLTNIQTYFPSFYTYLSNIASSNSSINSYVQQIFNILNDIDNTLDTITWLNASSNISWSNSINGTFDSSNISTNTYNDLYFKIEFNPTYLFDNQEAIIKLNLGTYFTAMTIPDDIEVFITNRYDYINCKFSYEYANNSIILYICNPIYNSYSSMARNIFVHVKSKSSAYIRYNSTYNSTNYILSNDIEYWKIKSFIYDNPYVNLSEQENIKDEVNEELNNLSQDMLVTKPSAVANIADSYVNQIDTSYNSSVFGFLGNSIVILMLCIVFAFAVLSYLLYGGK